MAALVSKVTVSGWWVLGGLSAALTSCIREIQRERSVAPLSSAQTQASTMKIGSRGKYFAKFWEIIEKFQTVVTNRVLGLTSRERRLLEKMQREHSSRQQASVSYIIVRTNIYIEIYHTVNRLRSFLSLGHLVTRSLGHSVTW